MTDPAPDTQQIEMLKTLLHDSRTERTRLADEVDRLRALADPAPVGLTEGERKIVEAGRHGYHHVLYQLVAIIDRLVHVSASVDPEDASDV